ncbi:unnamed protein product [Trifolium pratense]|uniref:Uncharacterized protein n=1 Tax=Trifolium pratense TaxID=57577 RepID=A0ACB0L6D5_TRIPR|nr:unnamed protein product [Trifolium pratense]
MDDQKIVTEEYSKPRWYSTLLMNEYFKPRYILAVVSITILWLSFIVSPILKTTSNGREFMAKYHDYLWIMLSNSFFFLHYLQFHITLKILKSEFEILIITGLAYTLILIHVFLVADYI